MSFKVGDIVKIKKGESFNLTNDDFEHFTWDVSMDKFVGELFKIRNKLEGKTNCYHLKDLKEEEHSLVIGYYWHENWLEKVEKKPLTFKSILAANKNV